MKLVILDGSYGATATVRSIAEAGQALGADVTHYALADLPIAPCLGDFACWTQTPGRCRTRDAAPEITQAIHDASLVVFLTPVVFGGYASPLKKLVDRLIPLTDAFFHEQAGMTRHQRRYARYPAMLFIGLAEQPDAETSSLFAELAGGNAINLQTPWFRSLLVAPDDTDGQQRIAIAVRAGLTGGPGELLPRLEPDALAGACRPDQRACGIPPRTASILIGSARPKGSSTSEALARALAADLERAGIASRFVYAISFVKAGPRATKALAELAGSELLVVAAPLYVDGLPALVTRALEQLAEHLQHQRQPLRQVVGLLNCGFPEAAHNRSALRLLRAFAHASCLTWAGGLAMGAGELIHGLPLHRVRLRARAQIRALRRAASDLAAGHGISPAASRDMARPLVPAFLFRWLAPLKWLHMGRAHGIGLRQLHARPLAEASPPRPRGEAG
jgi:NAD(P)H-dependent FMN reductase